jgi:hypothetical protein
MPTRGRQDGQDNRDIQDIQDDPKIAQLATRFGGQSLAPTWSAIPDRELTRSLIPKREPLQEPSGVELGESSTAARLIKQLYSFQGCTNESYQAHNDEHAQFDYHTREEPCYSFADLLHLKELKPSGPVTDVLSSLTLMGKRLESTKFDPVLAQQLYEGRGCTRALAEELELAAHLYLLNAAPDQLRGWVVES